MPVARRTKALTILEDSQAAYFVKIVMVNEKLMMAHADLLAAVAWVPDVYCDSGGGCLPLPCIVTLHLNIQG